MEEKTFGPISPEEVRKKRIDYIPAIIFEVFNELIISHFNGEKSVVRQDDVLNKVCTEESGLSRQTVFEKHYLDIEDFYREKGWKVEYDKPAYCETYPATFTFSIK